MEKARRKNKKYTEIRQFKNVQSGKVDQISSDYQMQIKNNEE